MFDDPGFLVGSPLGHAMLAGNTRVALARVFVKSPVDLLPAFVASSWHRGLLVERDYVSNNWDWNVVSCRVDCVDVARG